MSALRAPRSRVGSRRLLWAVVLLVILYAVVLGALSAARYFELSTGDWDLGTMQQALWSTTHGHPFYEADDYEMSGIPSLFQVHPSFLMVALVVPYALVPSPFLLLTLQAICVAAAAIPLYFIGRDVTGSEKKALLGSAVYLASPLVISANLADFHLESFLALELFTLFLLWRRRRYLWGAVPAFLAIVTIEVGPFLVGAVALYFLLPTIENGIRRLWARRSPTGEPTSPAGTGASGWRKLIDGLRPLDRRVTLALLILSGVAYLLLRAFQNDPGIVLLAPVAVSGNPPIAFPSGDLHLTPLNVGVGFGQRTGYWLLAYALVGFLPLRALRTQVLVLPWFVYTFVSGTIYTYWGLQYGFLPAFPLLIGFVFGIADLSIPSLAGLRSPRKRPDSTAGEPEPSPQRAPRRRWDVWARRPGLLGPALLLLLVVNVALSPLDPLLQNHDQGSGYQVSYVIPPGFDQVKALVGELPNGAVVLATDDLFPLVANDVHAYTLFPDPQALRHLPFNATHLPTYVLYSQVETYSVPVWLLGDVQNATIYRLVGQVDSTARGTVTLVELTSPPPTG